MFMPKQPVDASAYMERTSQSESHLTSTYASLDDWIAREAVPFSVNSPNAFSSAVDKAIASLGA